MNVLRFIFWQLGMVASVCADPKLTCERPLFDFGTLGNTQVVQHVFQLCNEGDETVDISRVTTSCGCISTSPNRGRIQPGGEFLLTVSADLKGRQGPQNKPVFVTWNNPMDARPLRLTLIGTATAGVEVVPTYVSFGVVGPTGGVRRVVRVFGPDTNQVVHVTRVACSDTRFTAHVRTVEPHHAFEIIVSATEPRALSSISAILTINTDHPHYSVINVPIYMRVHVEP